MNPLLVAALWCGGLFLYIITGGVISGILGLVSGGYAFKGEQLLVIAIWPLYAPILVMQTAVALAEWISGRKDA